MNRCSGRVATKVLIVVGVLALVCGVIIAVKWYTSNMGLRRAGTTSLPTRVFRLPDSDRAARLLEEINRLSFLDEVLRLANQNGQEVLFDRESASTRVTVYEESLHVSFSYVPWAMRRYDFQAFAVTWDPTHPEAARRNRRIEEAFRVVIDRRVQNATNGNQEE